MSEPVLDDSDAAGPAAHSAPTGPADLRAYISDMLAELAQMAARIGDRRLERGLRLLAIDSAALR